MKRKAHGLLITTAAVLAMIGATAVQADEAGSVQSTTPVYWIWDFANPVGTATLVRTRNGMSAHVTTTGLPAGQANTLWFIVFNNPQACSTAPCSTIDIFNPATYADFHYGGGNVTGNGHMTTLSGRLGIGDISGSGKTEIGQDAVPLIHPYQAEVHLVVHSHGPKLTGRELKAQLSTFLGGCTAFLGDMFGVAQAPGDVPSDPGQCSSIQASIH